MDVEYGGVLIVPLIVGLVEVAKRLGLGLVWAAPLALGLGLAISLGNLLAGGAPGAPALANATLQGLALGLAASGLYSGAKQLGERREDNSAPSPPGRGLE